MAHWIVEKDWTGEDRLICSQCKYITQLDWWSVSNDGKLHTCPSCKSVMDKDKEIVLVYKLQDMPQYHLGREVLCNVVRETIGYDVLMDAFCYGTFNQSDEFSWFRNDDEFYIIHLPSGMMINWYKHLGRTNTCSQSNRTLEDYYEFFKRFKIDLEYWAESKNIKLG